MEVVGYLIMIMVVPVAVMVCLTPRWQAICFVMGLVLAWDGALLARFAEQFLFMFLVPVGVVISLAALLVEAPAFAIRTFGKWRGVPGAGLDG